jgi:3-oxoacyl-[acyl-carrier protein] reductase
VSEEKEVFLVSGGSRGIGRAIVEALVKDGRAVAFTWNSDEAQARDTESLTGKKATAFHLDLRDRSRPADLVAEVESTIGPIVGLVNNAGIQRSGLTAMTTDESWDEVIDVNLGGAFRLTREVVRSMVTRRRGAIVNIASLSAMHGVPGHASYAASKAGLIAATRCLAREMGRRKIRANVVMPGFVETDMTNDLPEAVVTGLRSSEVLPGGTNPESVAEAVVFLLSDRASAITGQTIIVDAGTTA